MAWIKNSICGLILGAVKGICDVSLFTNEETEEIRNLKNLALSVLKKSTEISTDPVVCDAIQKGKQAGLDSFIKNAPLEAVGSGLVAAAELVCHKSFKQRFRCVLMGACLNLVSCGS